MKYFIVIWIIMGFVVLVTLKEVCHLTLPRELCEGDYQLYKRQNITCVSFANGCMAALKNFENMLKCYKKIRRESVCPKCVCYFNQTDYYSTGIIKEYTPYLTPPTSLF